MTKRKPLDVPFLVAVSDGYCFKCLSHCWESLLQVRANEKEQFLDRK